jgi:predicted transposase YdaD
MRDFEEVVERRGRIKGRKEGLQEGEIKGRKEEKINSIIKLLDKGFSEEEVIELLEVNEELIKEAKNKVGND